MKKLYSIITVFLMASVTLFAQDVKYLRVKIQLNDRDYARMASSGIPTDAGTYDSKTNIYQAEISEQDYHKLQELGIVSEVLIDDVSAYYAQRNMNINLQQIKQQAMRVPSDYTVPYDFELGSCGGFCTLEECYAHLDHMADLYPDLITVKQPASTLTSIEGRPIYYVKISDNANQSEEEPQVLYTGMHHAREGIGMQHLLFYMYYILEHYNTDPDIKALIDNTEMYFVPIINVDGYQYNITTQPNGGGMWRKNRRNNGGGSFGIDINRNYGFFWGYDDQGSSPYPSDETYRGNAPFSEPETQIMKEFCEAHNFKIALNYHSYSNLLLYPWGYISDACPDDNVFAEYSRRLSADNHYTYGPGSTTIYPTNGGSDDWMYGEQTTKNKILSYTPEIGGNGDGFWPQVSRIIPLCQENMLQSLLAAKLSGTYAEITDETPTILPEKQAQAYFNLTRLGQTDGTYTVSIEPLTANIISVGNPSSISNLAVLQTKFDSVSFQLNDNIAQGDTVRFVLVLDNGYFTVRDTVQKYFGTPVVVFEEDFPNKDNWTGGWGLYSFFPYSAPYSLADSPSGNYTNNANNSITLNPTISLAHASVAILNFYARWRIEPGYDYVQVKVSTNGGSTWTPLSGKYTHAGSNNQASGQPLYDGIVGSWVREEIDLSPWSGQSIKLRFTLRSDQNTVDDGYFFDNLSLTIIDVTTATSGQPLQPQVFMADAAPNPAYDFTSFGYTIPESMSDPILVISDMSGRKIMQMQLHTGEGMARLNTAQLCRGMYLYSLIAEGRILATKKLMIN